MLKKLETKSDAEHPQEEKYPSGEVIRCGKMLEVPKVGSRFFVVADPAMKSLQTSTIVSVSEDGSTFETLNSRYAIIVDERYPFNFVHAKDIEHESREGFANIICKLVYDRYEGNLESAVEAAEPLLEGLDRYVRNIYELVNNRIPLYALYNLKKHGADNYGLTDFEYEQAISAAEAACHEYYKKIV